MDRSPPRQTPLRAVHEALGASFTDFGGWRMPVRYRSELAEHHAVRTAAGLFDISHMAQFLVTGTAAAACLDIALAGRLSTMAVGAARYSLLLADDGTVVDDVIGYRLAENRFLLISNAGNRTAVAEGLGAAAHLLRSATDVDVDVEDVSDAFALLAVQGPAAEAVLTGTAGIGALRNPWCELRHYTWTDAVFDETPLLIARTGYTGEDGFELLVAVERAPRLWDALLTAGAPHGLVPAGLAARDSLRLEAGMPLYGHELTRGIRPAQVGLDRLVAHDKPNFVGKDAVVPAPSAPVLVGLVAEGRRAGRSGCAVRHGDETVGEVTSGALSPTLGHPIAMALVAPAVSAIGAVLTLDVRGTPIPATVAGLPFYRRKS